MGLELQISKRPGIYEASPEWFTFALLDSDKAADYPLNFVCMLPKSIQVGRQSQSRFVEIFGNDSFDLARKLLNAALKKETDVHIMKEIEERLRALEPKPIVQFPCVTCGATFSPKKHGRFFQRTCERCRNK